MKKKFKITMILFGQIIGFLNAFAQTAPSIQWQNTIGGNNMDAIYSVKPTNDNGFILCGGSSSPISGDKTETVIGGSYPDYWLVKTDSSGIIQWQNTIGGSDNDLCKSVQQTTDGGYILGGHSSSNISSDKTENCLGFPDFWIVKTDDQGNIQWENTIGGSGFDILNSIQQTTDGGYILGGSSTSNISGDKSENSQGYYDYWLVKLDSSGNIQWQNTIGGNDADRLYSVQETFDGGYILGGTSASGISGDKTENSKGYEDYWLVKTNALGNIVWQKTIGGSYFEGFMVARQSSDGGYILCGSSGSNISGDKTENNQDTTKATQDVWLVKTDSIGNIQWQNTIGGNNYDWVNSIQQTIDGGYLIAAYSASGISGDKTEENWDSTHASFDYWILKIDVTGNLQWQRTIGGNADDYISEIWQLNDGSYIAGGWSKSNISGDKTENNLGISSDYWIVKLNENNNLITGNLFIDANSNNVYDTGEFPLMYKKVFETTSGKFAFTRTSGNYNIAVSDTGSFTVMPPVLDYFNTIPATQNVYFPAYSQTDSLNDFAYQPTGTFNDLCITISPLGPFRRGMKASYLIDYENVGTTTLNPTVVFFPDANLMYDSSLPLASAVSVDSIVWSLGPVAPFQPGSIRVTTVVNATSPIGTLIKSDVRIDPVAGDANVNCNYANCSVIITAGVDPNEILVDEDTLLSSQLLNPPYLEYIIHFQNTGNDTAFNVKVLNRIDTNKLQLNTFELIATSHPVIIQWLSLEHKMEFTFSNILLPDSGIDETDSHGFIRYKIKPKANIAAGNDIINNAAIYFDFNAPVITNNAVTTIVLPTEIIRPEITNKRLIVFPNPAKESITILCSELPISGNFKLLIKDLFGRIVLQNIITGNRASFNISGLSAGIYVAALQGGDYAACTKFVKE